MTTSIKWEPVVGTGNRGARCDWNALPDRVAGQREMIVRLDVGHKVNCRLPRRLRKFREGLERVKGIEPYFRDLNLWPLVFLGSDASAQGRGQD